MFRCEVSAYIFTSCAVFWQARKASQNTNKEEKYTVILHTKTSNKRFIIQVNFFQPFSVTWKKTTSVKGRARAQCCTIANCTIAKCTISWDICTCFVHFLYNNHNSWLIMVDICLSADLFFGEFQFFKLCHSPAKTGQVDFVVVSCITQSVWRCN